MRLRALVVALALGAAVASAGPPSSGGLGGLRVPVTRPATLAVSRSAWPRMVFVSRTIPADGAIPGVGPAGRALEASGRLEIREPDGRVHPLLRPGRFADVSDPAVSFDGRRVAFAARAPGTRWRLWLVGADGRGLVPLTAGADSAAAFDDLDPCWLPDGRLVFASTRFAMRAQHGEAVTNLFVVAADGARLHRITAEREGGEEPTVDPRSGRIVYARWWFNRHRASDVDPGGLTLDPARGLPADDVDLWHAASVAPDGSALRLAGGDPRTRADQMAYQPLVLDDGTLVGVAAEHASLEGPPGHSRVHAFPGGFAAARRLTPATANACAPAALPDGRLVLAMDPAGGRRFALYAVGRDGRGLTRLATPREPDRAYLDPVALAPRRRPPVYRVAEGAPLPERPVAHAESLGAGDRTFRFDCLNVFANGPVDARFPDAPPMQPGLRMRFFAALERPDAPGRDTIVLVRESVVAASGAVHVEDLPADTPMFEQLIDAHGHVLRAAGGPAHVAGMNFARLGAGTQCVGCHTGHSALTVPGNAYEGEWTNASPSAEVTASSEGDSSAGARSVVDRRAKGNPSTVAWVADSTDGEWIALRWRWPIEVRAVVLYALTVDPGLRTDLRTLETELVLSRGGREVGRIPVRGTLSANGTRVSLGPMTVDRLEIRPVRLTGRVLGRRAAALAEVETIARQLAP